MTLRQWLTPEPRRYPLWLLPVGLLAVPVGLAMGLVLPGLFCLFVIFVLR